MSKLKLQLQLRPPRPAPAPKYSSLSSLALVATALTFCPSLCLGQHDQFIQVSLTARWNGTSILAEAGEFLSNLDNSLVSSDVYWKYIDNLLDSPVSPISPELTTFNDETERNLAKIAVFNIVSPAKLRIMDWALTARAYSPKVHMLQELSPPPEVIPSNCDAYVQYGKDKVTCSIDELGKLVDSNSFDDEDKPFVSDLDHKYPSFVWNQDKQRVFILYGHLTSDATKNFHRFLKGKADQVGYILRPRRGYSATALPLAGYGAELQFKSTEYKAQDDTVHAVEEEKLREIDGFDFKELHSLHPDLNQQLENFQNHLVTSHGKKAFAALKAWQVQELGLQASHYAVSQGNLLDALLDVSGNFPSHALALSSIKVPADFKKDVIHNQKSIQSVFNLDEGDGAFFLQGVFVDPDSLDLFTFMESVETELELMESLESIYHHEKSLTRQQIENVLTVGSKSSEPELALDLRDSSVYWINDLEKDEEYEDWPDDLTQLFYRMGGVMLRPVRRNVFNLLLTLDPEDIPTTTSLLKLAQSFMAHKAPLRIGVTFCSSGGPVREISNSLDDDETETELKGDLIRRVLNYALSEDKVRKAFNLIVEAYSTSDFSDLLKKMNDPGEEFDFGSTAACEFVKKSGRQTPAAFLNGIPLKWDSIDDFEEIVLNQLLREAQSIQIDAYSGKVRDSTDIFEYIMNKPNVQTRLNDKILDVTNSKHVQFGSEIWEPGKEPRNPLARVASSLKYLTSSGKRKTPVSVTVWLLADVSTSHGRNFVQNSIEFLEESSTHSRIAFIPTDSKMYALKRQLLTAFSANDIKTALKALRDFNEADLELTKGSNDEEVSGLLLRKLTGFPEGATGLIVNGRIIGPLEPSEIFDLGDWALVEKFSYDSCAKYIDTESDHGDIAMRVCSELGNPKIRAKNAKRITTMPSFQSTYGIDKTDEANPNDDPYYLDLKSIIDPASRHAHKMSAILKALQETLGPWIRVQIIFNPPSKHSELPLKSYYRYIAGNKPGETVRFDNIPREPLFTQNVIAPDNWMVEVVKGENDLDNIRLRDLSGPVLSQFELANLLVEGHCLELKSGTPPRGLQFTLYSQDQNVSPAETIVMANLGYFQLKAEPGVWDLRLREGPSKDIFALEPAVQKPVIVHSFQSVVVKVKVKRNPGKELVSLLDSEEEGGDGWFGFGGGNKKVEAEDDTINVFSLASGHLYERLLKIMMLSVMKNTKSKVKFWFLKNYLSPTIKDVLPHMAKEYGFEYELVQYHWPRWLNPQREKQRIIWGYKILFLDVLFPLSLKKFVFIDADQVVRTDLKELFELDLEGNPYGYTPFCDSRTEMEGFRFWKQGYWRSHLGKRKYHISALYVVDLVRFRRVAAGDRLRGQYQALSQDPNSLSNLDQDLPNNMIHQVGIKSLPQDWLWCETWCDDGSKSKAKTIDLCNNPQTKESKLEAAQRIIPEWKEYDQELKDFQNRLANSKKIHDEHDEL